MSKWLKIVVGLDLMTMKLPSLCLYYVTNMFKNIKQ